MHYQLLYNRTDNQIDLIYNGFKKSLTNSIASNPIKSPDGTRVVYMAPFEWEALTKLFMFNLQTGENVELIGPLDANSIPTQNGPYVPKDVIWINNNILAVIIGYAYGTVSEGGNIFIYYLDEKRLDKITSFDSKTQATKLIYEDNTLKFEGIQYIDDIMNEFKEINDSVDVSLFIHQ
ncbi:TPA: DUF4652 domain-containing protein [Bacillus toyonensis]|uniref:DUF4652 domain-containing protein n=1 Tax=Bacillus toyonensis TaxID=155322 RepID=UPI001C00BCE3|nr:DUF4652 domain-containing protein [Bacillus toyonensis]